MALFGFLVSAPLGHVLVKTMQRFFAGRTGPGVKLGMLATSLLVIAPIQISVFLANSAVVEGARTGEAIMRVVKRGFAPVLGVTWITSPTAIIFAQTFLPPEVRFHRAAVDILANYFPFPRSLKFPSSIWSSSALG